MFAGAMGMFIVKMGLKESLESDGWGEDVSELYLQETKYIDICLFVAAWLTPFTEVRLISYLLLVPIGFILCNVLYIQMNQFRQNRG
jgi:hypothetical protein